MQKTQSERQKEISDRIKARNTALNEKIAAKLAADQEKIKQRVLEKQTAVQQKTNARNAELQKSMATACDDVYAEVLMFAGLDPNQGARLDKHMNESGQVMFNGIIEGLKTNNAEPMVAALKTATTPKTTQPQPGTLGDPITVMNNLGALLAAINLSQEEQNHVEQPQTNKKQRSRFNSLDSFD